MIFLFRQERRDCFRENALFRKSGVPCVVGLLSAILSFCSVASPVCGSTYWAEDRSTTTTCAEEDNVNVPIFCTEVSNFRIVATHPTYCPCVYDGCPPDFSGCPPDGSDVTETCTKIWDEDGINVVEACTLSDWWRPYTMNCVIDAQTTSCHYLRLYRKIEGQDSWPQFFVLYEDGNMRLKPHPPEGIEDVCFGSSVIIGPATPAERPYVDIKEVLVNPIALSLDITYRNDETAHMNLSVNRSQAVAEVDVGYSTSAEIPFATFRSMWVEDGKCDVDAIKTLHGNYPILANCTSLDGPWWLFHRRFHSTHNTSAPDILIEVLPSAARVWQTMRASLPQDHCTLLYYAHVE